MLARTIDDKMRNYCSRCRQREGCQAHCDAAKRYKQSLVGSPRPISNAQSKFDRESR